MSKPKKTVIEVQGAAIGVLNQNSQDFICLTDMAKKFGDDVLIYSWMRNRNTLEFIGVWEQIHNPDFKGLEFETFRNQAGLNSFSLTPRKWIEATNAIGFQSRAGRYGGGTYAHQDIAFEFGSWLSPEFKLYLIKEFQRLKDDGRIDPVLDIPTLARVVVTIGDGMFWRRAVDPAFDVNRLLPAILETIGLLMRPVVNETPGKTLAPKTAEPA